MDIAAGLLSISAMIQSQVNSSKSNSLTEQAMISANLMSLFQIEKDAMIYGILSSSKKLEL
jgi:Tfp pilus assembly protein PilV